MKQQAAQPVQDLVPTILTSTTQRGQNISFAQAVLAWYDSAARELPWRTGPHQSANGARPDPYAVWLSEIMLQQTKVATVRDYFLRFIERWPDIEALAASDEREVLKQWAGLGYYSRARNLYACAGEISVRHGGRFPRSYEALIKLPGIGQYTAAAIAAIAFSRPVAVVDGNVERVIARSYRLESSAHKLKSETMKIVDRHLDADRPGDFAQAMMDLGATVCTPRKPACGICPLNPNCRSAHSQDVETFPHRPAKRVKPSRRGAAFVALNADGAVLLQRRGASGLLAGMSEVPGSQWNARQDGATGLQSAPFIGAWRFLGSITHTFTHFHLELEIYRADAITHQPTQGQWWAAADQIPGEALPSVMRKVIECALPGATKKGNG